MIEWYKKVMFENYANFSGRARRSEYWYFALMNVIIVIIAMTIDNMAGLRFGTTMPFIGPIYILYCLASFVPGLAVAVRRLHDVGKSGWFYFICLIPLIGAIWILILFFTDSQSGSNQYGPNPKDGSDEIKIATTEA